MMSCYSVVSSNAATVQRSRSDVAIAVFTPFSTSVSGCSGTPKRLFLRREERRLFRQNLLRDRREAEQVVGERVVEKAPVAAWRRHGMFAILEPPSVRRLCPRLCTGLRAFRTGVHRGVVTFL